METPLQLLKSLKRANLGRRQSKGKREPIQQVQLHQYSDEAYRRFLNILSLRRQKFLKQSLVQYYGKNYPITYRDHFLFEEGWESRGKDEQKKKFESNQSNSLLELLLTLFTIVTYSLAIWTSNIQFFFATNPQKIQYRFEIYAISLLITFIHFMRALLARKRRQESGNKIVKAVKELYTQIISIIYFILKLCEINNSLNCFGIAFEIIVLLLLYLIASKMYQRLRLSHFIFRYEYQFKVLDMALSIFVIGHFIAIFLYLTTRLSPENNWTTPLSIDHSDPFALYVYSFYFCSTTIMTVGYGDITPKNAGEVVAVVLVQIFGVIVLGYIINQIGYCVSSLRRGQQTVEKDLAVVEKMRRHYRMDADLAHRVRQYVLNSKPNVHQLSPDEEHAIANKLNEEIRVELAAKNMLSVVKSSLFFLCRWSKQFQSAVSLKLTHTLFNPNDVLHQPFGNERIYIIKKGKVDVYAGKRLNKVLKTIDSKCEKEISDNSYGITGVISVRKPKSYAVSKGFTSAYFIEGEKFKECVNERAFDFEFYHQLKSKMDQAKHGQSVQINSLMSTKHHYIPSRSFIIIRHLKKLRAQGRKFTMREEKCMFRGNKLFCDSNIMEQVRHKIAGSYATIDGELIERVKFNNIDAMKEDLALLSKTNMDLFDHYFEQSKQYSNYFVKNNKSNIVKAVELEQFVRQPVQ